jgi:transposase
MCSIYASAVRRMLPHAQLAIDAFHIVQLATRWSATCAAAPSGTSYGRRGRSGDREYGIKNLLVRNLEHLNPDQSTPALSEPEQSVGETPDPSSAALMWRYRLNE